MKLVPTPTRTLTGLALNYAVARAEKHQSRCEWMLEQKGYHAWQSYERAWGNPIPDYCGDPAAAYPIILRERIDTTYDHDWLYDGEDPDDNGDRWYAEKGDAWTCGPDPLIAAMRCFCLAHYGDTVEVPEELL
jgi:hypothetical protein